MWTTKLLKLLVLFLMHATLLVMPILQKPPLRPSKVLWKSSTPTKKFFDSPVSILVDFLFLANILFLIIHIKCKTSVHQAGYAHLSLNHIILQLSKNHGGIPTTTKPWGKCSWQINVLISLQLLELILLIEECFPLPFSNLKMQKIWMTMNLKIKIVQRWLKQMLYLLTLEVGFVFFFLVNFSCFTSSKVSSTPWRPSIVHWASPADWALPLISFWSTSPQFRDLIRQHWTWTLPWNYRQNFSLPLHRCNIFCSKRWMQSPRHVPWVYLFMSIVAE